MKPAPFEYVRPESLEEALAELARHGDEAKVLAGGQSLVPVLNMRLLRPSVVIDLGRLPGLDGIERRNGAVAVGALTTQRAFQESPLAPPLAAEALPHVGHYVTRNRGTVGGSIAHADAAAELPLCLAVLGGSVVAASPGGTREIAAADFFVTHFTTTLETDELVVETLWPTLDMSSALGAGHVPGAVEPNGRTALRPLPDMSSALGKRHVLGQWGFAFEEFSQRRGDFALAAAAAALRIEDGKVAEARVGLASVVDRPTLVETELAGNEVTPELARATGEAAAASLDAYGNLHASPAYLRQLTRVCVERAVLRAAG